MQRILALQKLEVAGYEANEAGSCTSSWSGCC
jgi:hypothetical protein